MSHLTGNGDRLPPTAMSELETLSLKRAAENMRVLELGAEYGYSTIVMARVAQLVISVDWHQGYIRDDIGPRQDTVIPYLWNLHDYLNYTDEVATDNVTRSRVIPVVGRFQEVLPLLADKSFDFVFIDGGHDYDTTRFCFEHADRLTHGVVATHDFGHPKCAEQQVAADLGWVPRLPVVGTLALFDPEGRKGQSTGIVPAGVNYSDNPWAGLAPGDRDTMKMERLRNIL